MLPQTCHTGLLTPADPTWRHFFCRPFFHCERQPAPGESTPHGWEVHPTDQSQVQWCSSKQTSVSWCWAKRDGCHLDISHTTRQGNTLNNIIRRVFTHAKHNWDHLKCWHSKISPIWDWRSTPTYCQLQSNVTQKLWQKMKNPAPIRFRYYALI